MSLVPILQKKSNFQISQSTQGKSIQQIIVGLLAHLRIRGKDDCIKQKKDAACDLELSTKISALVAYKACIY